MVTIIILSIVYVISILFCWYSFHKAFNGGFKNISIDLFMVFVIFLPIINLVMALTFMEQWEPKIRIKWLNKFFKIKK